MPSRSPQGPRHGAWPLSPTHTRFALWAPDARSVSLQRDSGERLPMLPAAHGWYELDAPWGVGSRYRFVIDDQHPVPDPAARAQATDVHGYSLVIDPDAYRWQHPQWRGRPWHEAVIYELHVGALGGYGAVVEHLPRLAALGVTAIELMPLAQFPGTRNWGYDGVLLYAPHAAYGSPDDLKALIDAAHGHGLMVLLDVVYNHFGPDGNYLGQYAKAFFREDKHTPWGAAIDYRQGPVREFFIDNARMWLQDYRFDGLRLDAVHAIDDSTFLHDLAREVRQHLDPARQVWLTLENEFNQASLLDPALQALSFDGQWNDDGHNALHVLLTGETEAYYADFAERPTEHLARCLSQGFAYQGQPDRHGRPRGEPSGHLPPSAFVLFLQNHDQVGNRALGERLSQLCPPPALRAATLLLLLSPMIPLLFMGDEWAASEPFLFFTDHHAQLADAVRDGRRNEFTGFPAFADPQRRAAIPDPNARATFEASRPGAPASAEQQAMLAWHHHLLKVRQQHLTPHLPGTQALGAVVLGTGAVSARWRLGDGSVLQIDLNLGVAPVTRRSAPHARVLAHSTAQPPLAQLPAHSAIATLAAPLPEDPTW